MNYFVQSIPKSHFVHKSFARTINARNIKPAPRWFPFILIPFFSFIKIVFTFYKYKSKDNFFCEGFAGLYFARILKIFKPNITIIYHDVDTLFYRSYPQMTGFKKKYIDFFLDKIDYAISDSELSKKHLTKHLRLKKQSKIIYPFLRKKEFKFKPTLNSRDIIYVGRLSDEKNLFTLLKAFKKINKKYNNTLYIIGSGSLKKELETFSKKLDINKNINFLGWIENFNAYLDKSIIGYNVSKFDAFGCSGLEFALSGVIPLLSIKNGNIEVLTEKKIICNPNSVKDIVKKYIKLIKLSKSKKLKLLKKLKKQAKEYDKKRQCKRFKKTFEGLVK